MDEVLGVVVDGVVESEFAACLLERDDSARVSRKMLHWWLWERWVSAWLWKRLNDDRFELWGFVEKYLGDDVAVGVELRLEEHVTNMADGLVAADGRPEASRENRGENFVWIKEGSVNIMALEWGFSAV